MRLYINIIIVTAFFCILSSCTDETPWTQYTSKEAGFTIFMPAGAVKTDKKIGKEVIHYITWKPTSFALNKFKMFEVSYTDYPGNIGADTVMLNSLLDTAINQRKKDFNETDIVSQAISINGYRGRAFIYEVPKGNTITIVKECIAGNRRYDVTVIAKKDYPTNDEINRFFNSFQVLR